MRVMVTGAAGFAGSHIAALLSREGCDVVSVDCLTYAGRLESLSKVARAVNICHDIAEPLPLDKIGKVDWIVHNAAESHVDRSFTDTGRLVRTNVIGTLNVLEAARKLKPSKLVYTSTDEVFGPRRTPASEGFPLAPTNPYAAAKAAGEMLVRGHAAALGVPAVILRTVNMFGERQHREKFIPMVIGSLLSGRPVDVHISDAGDVGSRQWVYVGHQAAQVLELLKSGEPGDVQHLSGPIVSNLDMAELIARMLGKRLDARKILSSRPFHDLHYFLSGRGPANFEAELAQTVKWYAENRSWL